MHTYICMYVCMYVRMYVYVRMCMYVCMYLVLHFTMIKHPLQAICAFDRVIQLAGVISSEVSQQLTSDRTLRVEKILGSHISRHWTSSYIHNYYT